MIIRSGKIEAIESAKPDIDKAEIRDYGNQLILPVFVDLHYHSVQYAMRGLGRDKELLPWLHTYTFKEEARFANIEYAERVFKQLLNELWTEGSFNLCTFSSLHLEATLRLMDMYEANEFRAYVGKVNMDSNDPVLVEDTDASFENTKRWIEESRALKYAKPIITPRFAPSCTKSSQNLENWRRARIEWGEAKTVLNYFLITTIITMSTGKTALPLWERPLWLTAYTTHGLSLKR